MRIDSRLDNFLSWLTGSVLVATAMVLAIRSDEGKRQEALQPKQFLPTPAQEPLSLQVARATETGRGRRAQAPSEIPWVGWKDILVRTYREIQSDRLFALAAAVAFYSLLALFPSIGAGVSSYALFADPGTISKHLS